MSQNAGDCLWEDGWRLSAMARNSCDQHRADFGVDRPFRWPFYPRSERQEPSLSGLQMRGGVDARFGGTPTVCFRTNDDGPSTTEVRMACFLLGSPN